MTNRNFRSTGRSRRMTQRVRVRQRMSMKQRIVIAGTAFSILLTGGLFVYFNFSGPQQTMAAVANDYRTIASGDWNSISTWEYYDGTRWLTPPAAPTSSRNVIEIQSGHTITISTNVTVDQFQIDSGGVLEINQGAVLSIANGAGPDFIVNGTVNQNGTISCASNSQSTLNGTWVEASTGVLTVGSGGRINVAGTFVRGSISAPTVAGIWNFNNKAIYRHYIDGGGIPLANWNAGSTCEITGIVSTVPTGLTQSFSNFTWNCPSQTGSVNYGASLTRVGNDFTIISTGSGSFFIDQQGNNTALNIGRDLNFNGGTVYICYNGSSTINITRNLNVTGGNFNFNQFGATGYGNTSAVINVRGNAVVSGGTLDMSQYSGNNIDKGWGVMNLWGHLNVTAAGLITATTVNGRGVINFTGSGTIQNFRSARTITRYVDYNVLSGAVVDSDTNIFTGWGNFNLNSGGGFRMGHPNGITNSTMTGNVQVSGSRSYSTGADYTYMGAAMQNSGDGLPGTVRDLTLNNSNNCNLTNSSSVSRTIYFQAGLWITTGDTLTLGTSTLNLGSLVRVNGHVVGHFRRWLNTTSVGNILFPVGSLNYYNGANFNFVVSPLSAGSIVATYLLDQPSVSGLPILDAGDYCDKIGYGYWICNPFNGFSGGTYNLTLYANGMPGVSDYTKLHVFRRATTSDGWSNPGGHIPGTGSNDAPVGNRGGMTVYNQFGIVSGNANALPVELTHFEAKPAGDDVRLRWTTESEVNNDFFTVQRSVNGFDFEDLGRVNGYGTTTVTRNYEYFDHDPLPGTSYYRLRQFDYDGKFEDSPIRSVKRTAQNADATFLLRIDNVRPSASSGSVRFSVESTTAGQVTIMLTDISGRQVMSRTEETTEGVSQIELDHLSISSGIYILSVFGKEGADSKRFFFQ